MNLRLCFYCLIACFIRIESQAQVPNEPLFDSIKINSTDSGRFGFSFLNTNYMRNTEYFNPIEEGRTLFGYQLQPKINYQPFRNVIIEVGLWVRHDFGGNNPYTLVLPTFSMKANRNFSEIIFGTLQGSLSHGLLEPMLDINSIIENRIENGFQYIYNNKKNRIDFWINWENYIEPKEFAKEKFTAGFNGIREFKTKNKLTFSPYLQGLASHQGGQIDSDTISPFMMQFNNAIGVKIQKKLNAKKVMSIDISYLNYLETSDSKLFPYKNGNAIYGNISFSNSITDLMVSYWNGNNFIAPRGTSIYQSKSTVDSKNYEENRQLLFFRIIQNKPLFNSPIIASARFEPIYDLNNGILDFSYSLYLIYRGDWLFKK